MCGFSGFILKKEAWLGNKLVEKYLNDMGQAILHRGPDDQGKFISEKDRIGLVFQRLSILDLSKLGRQPMFSKCKRWMIAYNGEVYNFRELKKNISIRADYWTSNTDTEVILENISKLGFTETISKLNGMFAIAAYCFKTKTLWLARDKFGEKPLYYSLDNKKGIFFSSEIKSFNKIPFFTRKINANAVANYLRYGYVPDPLSILQNSFKLAPGKILKFKEEECFKTFSYWNTNEIFEKCNSNQFKGSYKDAVEETKARIDNSCKNRLLADVPVGAFLSGGIDSSNLIYSFNRQNININTFSVGFHDTKTNELQYAKEIAKKFDTKHHEIIIGEKQCLEEIQNIATSYDEPFADPSQIPTFLLSKYTRKRVKVAISGEGADELFGGYPRYNKITDYWKKTKDIPLFLKKFFHHISLKSSPSSTKFIYSIGKKMRKLSHLSLDELYKDEMSKWRPDEYIYHKTDLDFIENGNFKNDIVDFRKLMLKDMNSYLPGNLLVKVDRASMTNSLEVRSPFLDENLIKFVWSLPNEYINIKNSKAILKDILSEKVSEEFIQRPKQGFEPPLEKWMRGPLKEWIGDLLSLDDNYLDKKKINKTYNIFLNGEKKLTYKVWTIIMFKAWKLHNFS